MKTKAIYPFYCVVTEEISQSVRNILTQQQIPYIDLDTSDIGKILNKCKNLACNSAYIKASRKLKIFTLTQFDKCLYVDSDMLILENIDDVFEKPMFTAVEDLCTSSLQNKMKYLNGMTSFNGGFFVFVPSMEYYDYLIQTVQSLPPLDPQIYRKNDKGIYSGWHDQSILAYCCKN